MPFKNPLAGVVVIFLLLISNVLPTSWVSDAVRFFLLGYLGLGFVLHAVAGYRRRRPFWTADSWRRYLLTSAIPIASLGIMFAMTALVDSGHPIVGAGRSAARTVWVMGTLAFMLVGAAGLVLVVHWLHDGEASEPFSISSWVRQRGRGDG